MYITLYQEYKKYLFAQLIAQKKLLKIFISDFYLENTMLIRSKRENIPEIY